MIYRVTLDRCQRFYRFSLSFFSNKVEPRESSKWRQRSLWPLRGFLSWDHVSLRIPRSIYRPMHRSLYRSLLDRHDRHAIDCRPRVDRSIGRASTDVGRGIDHDHTGSLSDNYRWYIGQLSTECRSCIMR